MPNRAGISYPKARSIVSSQRGPRQQAPQGHLPALKPLKPLKPLRRLKRLRPDPSLLLGGPTCRSLGVRSQQSPSGMPNRAGISYPKARSIVSSQRGPRQQAPQGHNNGFLGFLWASKPAVCQPLNP